MDTAYRERWVWWVGGWGGGLQETEESRGHSRDQDTVDQTRRASPIPILPLRRTDRSHRTSSLADCGTCPSLLPALPPSLSRSISI